MESEAKSVDGAQWRSQIVRNGIAEGLQLAVDALKFRGAHTHTIFERFIE
jgi:hypothetical protein